MSIVLVEYPRATLQDQTDYAKQNALIEALNLASSDRPIECSFDGSFPNKPILILKGNVFQIGGAVYRVTADETITGTSSHYVKITPSSGTASASFVSSLAGVTWSNVYNGYYDGSGNLYIFDEGYAYSVGAISVRKKRHISFIGLSIMLKNGELSTNENSGAAIGIAASATTGGAVGKTAQTTTGGAVGDGSFATTGGAVGDGAGATGGGGAVGYSSYATTGGAVGYDTYATDGFSAGNGAISTGLNRIALGQGCINAIADNTIRLGKAGTTTYLGDGSTVVTSDKRDKIEIQDNDLGIEFLEKIATKKYKYNYRELYWKKDKDGKVILDKDKNPTVDYDEHKKADKKGIRWHRGMIAQELAESFDTKEFAATKYTGINNPSSDYWGIDYIEFIPVLIRAVQELSAKIKEIENKNK